MLDQINQRIYELKQAIKIWGSDFGYLKHTSRSVNLFALDASVKQNPLMIEWSKVSGEMSFKDFGYFHGNWRTTSALFAELQDHMFIRHIDSYLDGNGWHMEVATVSDNKRYHFDATSKQGLIGTFFESQIGHKVLFQDNVYRNSISVENYPDIDIIKTLDKAVIMLKDAVLPPVRTNKLLEKIDRCLDDIPEPPDDDDDDGIFNNRCDDEMDWSDEKFDDGYNDEMEWSDWEQPGFEHEWYPNPEC